MEQANEDGEWLAESYKLQNDSIWPGRGQHILAQYTDEYVVVYQAFNDAIANAAVERQNFIGIPGYNPTRMTWIKSNFAWMMFRSKWASKPNQTSVLAIFLKRAAFDGYLLNARTNGTVREAEGTIRLQWDPDHLPSGSPHHARRAVQLGLRGVSTFADGTDIVKIVNVTDFCIQQRPLALRKKGYAPELMSARERVYIPKDAAVCKSVGIDM